MKFKKIGKLFTSKFVGSGHSSYKKRIYRAAVPQKLRTTVREDIILYNLKSYINIEASENIKLYINPINGFHNFTTLLQREKLRFGFQMKSLDFSTDVILPVALFFWGRLSF
jgi:hypothetical protein